MAYVLLSSVADAAAKIASFVRNLDVGSSSPSSTRDLPRKIQEDARRLSRMVKRIRALLEDAEEREIKDKSVRFWLRELEGVAYDAEDVLEELQYEMLSPQMEGHGLPAAGHTGAQGITISHDIVAFLQYVEQRIVDINLRFQEVSENRVALELKESDGQRRVRSEILVREPTSSLIMEESQIVGRREDIKIVKKFLLSEVQTNESAKVPVMAIVGMGGLGKTALTQLAYNDVKISNKFDLKAWVCVSEDFDLIKVTQAMVESFTGNECRLSGLDPLHRKLTKELAGKRYLLVLDDVWELGLERVWDSLIRPLQQDGTKGSKIIITTRNVEVSRIARASVIHHLPCLQEEECLRVFCHSAFEGRDPATLHDLLVMGEEISKKCAGVPLAAKILGSQLRWVDDVQRWEDIIEGDIWDIDRQGIIPILKLSYDLLPARLKKCFKFCSLFPKDHRFGKDRLVQMWMANGCIMPKRSRQMEDIGMDYFDELLWRSFFQQFTTFLGPSDQVFQMHDLIHDLARYVSGDEYCSLEDGKSYSKTEGNVRHLSAISSNISMDVINHIQQPTLRSFIFIRSSWKLATSMKALDGVLILPKYLRVLDLCGSNIEYLPSSMVGCLKLLRYLGLPPHLRLPDSISKLLNLQHLIYQRDVIYPVGIGKLTNLQTMPGFICRPKNDRHAKLGELKDINNIRNLRILGIDKFTSVEEAKKACLQKKEHLRELQLRWDCFEPSPFDDELLETLKPNHMLRRLKISRFKGLHFPSWLGDDSFSKLTSVELMDCDTLSSLPCLGKLPSLNYLSITSNDRVKHIDQQFFSGGFPRLETLQLERMSILKSWQGVENGEYCPCLRKLILSQCRLLASISVSNLLALQVLHISYCDAFLSWRGSLLLQSLPSLQEIEIKSREYSSEDKEDWEFSGKWELPNLEAEDDDDMSLISKLTTKHCPRLGALPHLEHLEKLEVESCAQLMLHNPLTHLSSLQTLQISDIPGLLQLPALPKNLVQLVLKDLPAVANLQIIPPTVRDLTLEGCNEAAIVEALPCLTNLTSLRISQLPNLARPLSLHNLVRLQKLEISNCPKLESLNFSPESGIYIEGLQALASLVRLSLVDCPNLRFPVHYRPPSTLRYFAITNCPQTLIPLYWIKFAKSEGTSHDPRWIRLTENKDERRERMRFCKCRWRERIEETSMDDSSYSISISSSIEEMDDVLLGWIKPPLGVYPVSK